MQHTLITSVANLIEMVRTACPMAFAALLAVKLYSRSDLSYYIVFSPIFIGALAIGAGYAIALYVARKVTKDLLDGMNKIMLEHPARDQAKSQPS